MFLEWDHYFAISAHELQLYMYLLSQQHRSSGKTVSLSKLDITKALGINRNYLDKRLKALVDVGYIKVVSEPRKPLVVEFINVRLDNLLTQDGAVNADALDPADDDGPGEYLS